MGEQQWKRRTRASWIPLLVLCTAAAACGGVIQFKDERPVVIEGTGPEPPKAPEPPPPPPPKRVEVTQDKIVIREKIQFEVDKAEIKAESHGLLAEIVEVLKDNPQIKEVSIEGHTDSDGSDKYNATLSDKRAAAVLQFLVKAGVAETRLRSKGWGEAKPIASNDDEVGKERNRRVEFLITKQDTVKKTFEIDPKTGQRREVDSAGKEKGK